ncbi:hypothetical protein VNO77_21798 [Canavalia gladiata]|uniref:Transmembrane protein n=1 Tax=Canavalia gladiata TaxID=3824 RepID=A0AAN9QDX6_CANGL
MSLVGFLKNLQDIYAKHKLISTIFLCLLVIPPSYFYTFYVTGYLCNVFLTNDEHANNLMGTTIHYIRVVTLVEGFTVFGLFLFFLPTPLLNMLASHKIDPGAELKFKDLILMATKPARSFVVTWFFVKLFKLGYVLLGILLVFPQYLMFIDSSSHEQPKLCDLPGSGTMILVAGGIIFFAYLTNFGNLAIQVSLYEGISGIEVVGKASQLLEGKKKLIGFLLNVVFGVVSVGLFMGYEYLNTCSKLVDSMNKKSNMLFIWQIISQLEFYTWICFSVLYFRCKNARGEKIFQPEGSLKRILLQDQPLVHHSSSDQMK